MADRRIDPSDPHPSECPSGMAGKPPWCYSPTVRAFARLVLSDSNGKPSSARVLSVWAMLLGSLVMLAGILGWGMGRELPPEGVNLVYTLIGAATGINGLGRLGGKGNAGSQSGDG